MKSSLILISVVLVLFAVGDSPKRPDETEWLVRSILVVAAALAAVAASLIPRKEGEDG